jgi:hypothetical protein
MLSTLFGGTTKGGDSMDSSNEPARRKSHWDWLLWVPVVFLALFAAVSPCLIVGIEDGRRDYHLQFEPNPAPAVRISYFRTRTDHVASAMPYLSEGPRTHPEMTRLDVSTSGTAELTMPVSTRDCSCYGLHRSTRTIPFDTVILEFRDGEDRRHLEAIPLPDFDGPRRLTVAVPQEFQTVPAPR